MGAEQYGLAPCISLYLILKHVIGQLQLEVNLILVGVDPVFSAPRK